MLLQNIFVILSYELNNIALKFGIVSCGLLNVGQTIVSPVYLLSFT